MRKGEDVLRILVRVSERFRFRLHVRPLGSEAEPQRRLVARQMVGKPLPAFLYADLDMGRGGPKHKDTVKFWGVPRAEDIGEVHVGVYESGGECVGRAIIEVIGRGG